MRPLSNAPVHLGSSNFSREIFLSLKTHCVTGVDLVLDSQVSSLFLVAWNSFSLVIKDFTMDDATMTTNEV